MINSCSICKKEFKVKQSVLSKGYGKYCSSKCKGKAYQGNGNPKWGGGIMLASHGYKYIYSPGHPYAQHHGYVMEHRLMIEKNIGRFLDPKEVVHHKNGIKFDNRIENLRLFNSHSEHFKYEINEGHIPLDYWKGKSFSEQHRQKLREKEKLRERNWQGRFI